MTDFYGVVMGMRGFYEIINSISLILNILGALITIWGVIIALYGFIVKEISRQSNSLELNESLRLTLGSYLVLALEFFIASDIIKTVLTPSWEGLGMLGAIVVIRTVLSYFLTQELKKSKIKEVR